MIWRAYVPQREIVAVLSSAIVMSVKEVNVVDDRRRCGCWLVEFPKDMKHEDVVAIVGNRMHVEMEKKNGME